MAEFVPQLNNMSEFQLGEHPRVEEGELPLIWLLTFIKPNVSIIASSIGLYLKRIDGDISGVDLRANIYAYDPFWTAEPETPGVGQKVATLASNVDVKALLAPPSGWKAMPIAPFTFEANRTYIVMFEMVSEPHTSNGAVDSIVLSGAERFDIPMVPADWPGPQRQAKDAYGFNKNPRTGFVYTYPLAMALYGEAGPEPPQQPPVQAGGILMLLLAVGLGVGMLVKR